MSIQTVSWERFFPASEALPGPRWEADGPAEASLLSSSAGLLVSLLQPHLQEVLRLSGGPGPTPHAGQALHGLESPQGLTPSQWCSSRGASAPTGHLAASGEF